MKRTRAAWLTAISICACACTQPNHAAAPNDLKAGEAENSVSVAVEVEVALAEQPGGTDAQTPEPTASEPTKPIPRLDRPRVDDGTTNSPSPPPPPIKGTEPKRDGDPSIDEPHQQGTVDPLSNIRAAAVRSAQGVLEPGDVQKAVERAIDTFRPCLRADTVVVLDAKVTPEGDVTEAKGISSRPEDPVARDCVAFAFRKLQLGQTGALEASTFRLTLSLKRRG